MRYSKNETTYILANFESGDTVTIDIYKLSDNSQVVNAGSCSEIGSTGVFKYLFSQTISQKEEYLWIASNGSYSQMGKIVLGGWMDNVKDKVDDNLDVAVSTRSSHTPADVADAVWDEKKEDHIADGSVGDYLTMIFNRTGWDEVDYKKIRKIFQEEISNVRVKDNFKKYKKEIGNVENRIKDLAGKVDTVAYKVGKIKIPEVNISGDLKRIVKEIKQNSLKALKDIEKLIKDGIDNQEIRIEKVAGRLNEYNNNIKNGFKDIESLIKRIVDKVESVNKKVDLKSEKIDLEPIINFTEAIEKEIGGLSKYIDFAIEKINELKGSMEKQSSKPIIFVKNRQRKASSSEKLKRRRFI